MGYKCAATTLAAAVLAALAPAAMARELSFGDRLRAEQAIARVYYTHTLGVTKPFDQVYSAEILEARVNDYLRRSAALKEYWNTPITADALQAEARRIRRGTKSPDRLEEIYAALGRDEFVFEECVARATLSDRLSRSFFERDPRFGPQSSKKDTWDEWWRSVGTAMDGSRIAAVARDASPNAQEDTERTTSAAACPASGTWDPGVLQSAPDGRNGARAVWTGTLMLIWGGGLAQNGLRYDPATDGWSGMTTIGAPVSRQNHVMVWTGSQLIVWGGDTGTTAHVTGGRYDPASDTWTSTPTFHAPIATSANFYTGVWTGSLLVVWGVKDPARGGRYDPNTNSWSSITTVGAPQGGYGHSAVWTGSRMLVWGGAWGSTPGGSGSYDPATDSWSAIATAGAPANRGDHTAVWTGTEMILWGGVANSVSLSTGGRYRPSNDSWQPFDDAGSPAGRYHHAAVWTGSAMIVWGGQTYQSPIIAYGDGARYDPADNSWHPIAASGAPTPRWAHTAVWDGARMIVYGGRDAASQYPIGDGARYSPSSDSWTPVSLGSAPSTRGIHSAVWTGTELIVWGGHDYRSDTALNTGSRYDPALDQWTPCSIAGAPSPRAYHSVVWTGSHMIVWGGSGFNGYPNTGGRYDPVADLWTPTTTVGAPLGRDGHGTVWTGREMLVWGGGNSLNSGGRYDPIADAWTAISTVGAPSGRHGFATAWTGKEMLVWGGTQGGSGTVVLNDGGRYNPSTNSWQSIPTESAPQKRFSSSAANKISAEWSGREFIVWGGVDFVPPNTIVPLYTGGRFDPETNAWSATNTINAPPAGAASSAWIGSELMVMASGSATKFYDPAGEGWRTISSDAGSSGSSSPLTLTFAHDFAIQWGGIQSRSGSRYVVDSDWDGAPNLCDLDDDNDGTLDTSDCAPYDSSASILVTETTGVTVNGSTSTQLGWMGQASARFDVAGGSLADLHAGGVSGAACLVNDQTGTAWNDPRPNPALGDGYYYIVRAENVCGDGGWGSSSSGAVRQPLAPCP